MRNELSRGKFTAAFSVSRDSSCGPGSPWVACLFVYIRATVASESVLQPMLGESFASFHANDINGFSESGATV